jgi:hypothetical protein
LKTKIDPEAANTSLQNGIMGFWVTKRTKAPLIMPQSNETNRKASRKDRLLERKIFRGDMKDVACSDAKGALLLSYGYKPTATDDADSNSD